jgi:hypothetical protein
MAEKEPAKEPAKRYGAPPHPRDGREAMRQVGQALWGDDWKNRMAGALGLSRVYVSLMDAGKRPVTAATIDLLCGYVRQQIPEEIAAHGIKMVVLQRLVNRAPPKPAPKIAD